MNNIEIKKILVPIDFTETSETAMYEAITLAGLLKAEICLIHVIEFNGYHFSIVPETQTMLPSMWELERAVEKKMNEMQEKIRKEFGFIPEVCVTTGSAHSEIIGFSKEKKFDLIVMGAHGTSGYKEMFIGSNAQRVVTLSDIPVLTLQKEINDFGFKNILIPIDNSLHSREKINIAMVLADLFGATIHLLGIPDSKNEDENEMRREWNEIETKLKSVKKIVSSGNHHYKYIIKAGSNLATTALKYATEHQCDLIVINTGHESKLTGGFLGAFAQQIVNHSKIPVLSCKHSEGQFSIDTPDFGIE